jgi:nitrogen fixation protein FixH
MISVRAALLAAVVATLAPQAWAQGEAGNPTDERVSESFNAAQSYQGPLDGSWTLVTASGRALMAFQLVDKPGGQGPLEGVWRDLRRPAAPGDIGFVDALIRGPGTLSITLNATPGSQAVTISLHADPSGAWSGVMHENGADAPVKLRRG